MSRCYESRVKKNLIFLISIHLILPPKCSLLLKRLKSGSKQVLQKGFSLVIDAGLVESFHRQVTPAPAEFESQSRHLSLTKMAASSSSLNSPFLPPHPPPPPHSSPPPAAFCFPSKESRMSLLIFSILSFYPPLRLLLNQHVLSGLFFVFFFCFSCLNLNLLRNKTKHANT